MSKNVDVQFSWLKMYYTLLESRVFYGYTVLHEENNSKDESDTFPKQQVWYTNQQISKG
jgi:hypothetical protein